MFLFRTYARDKLNGNTAKIIDIFAMVATLCGIATSVALDVIAKVGSWGNFLREKHTLKNFKSMFYSDLFERVQYESWQKKGGKLIEERLREKP